MVQPLETTCDPAVSMAVQIARRYGRRYGVDPAELLGAAWEGTRSVAPGSPALYYRVAAAGGIGRYVRHLLGKPGSPRSRYRPLTNVVGVDDADVNPIAPEYTPDPQDRIQTLWEETRPQREGWSWRTRIILYLFAVEQMSYPEIGAAFGISRFTVAGSVRADVGVQTDLFNVVGSSRKGQPPVVPAAADDRDQRPGGLSC
jgi:hypothetical protein